MKSPSSARIGVFLAKMIFGLLRDHSFAQDAPGELGFAVIRLAVESSVRPPSVTIHFRESARAYDFEFS